MSSSAYSRSADLGRASPAHRAAQQSAELRPPRARSDQPAVNRATAPSTGSSRTPSSLFAALYPPRVRSAAAPAETTSSHLGSLPPPTASASTPPRRSRIPSRLPPVNVPAPSAPPSALPRPPPAASPPTLSSSSTAPPSSSTSLRRGARSPPLPASSRLPGPRRGGSESASASSASHGLPPSRAVGRSRLFALSLERVAEQGIPKMSTTSPSTVKCEAGGAAHAPGLLSMASAGHARGPDAPRAAPTGPGGPSRRAVAQVEALEPVETGGSLAQPAPRPSRSTGNGGGPSALERAISSSIAPPVLLSIKGASQAELSVGTGTRLKRERSPSPSSEPVKRFRAASNQLARPAPPPAPSRRALSTQGPRWASSAPLSQDQIDPMWNDCTFADFAPFLHDEHVEPAFFHGFYEDQIELLRACAPVADWHPDPARLGARMTRLPPLAAQVGARQPSRRAIRAAVGPLRSAPGYNELDDKARRVWKWLAKVVGWVWVGGGSATPDEVSYVARTAPKPVMLIFRRLAHVLALRELVDRAYEQLKAHLDRRRRAFTATAREAAALVLVEWLLRTGPASPQVDRRALFFGRADGRVRRDDEGERPWVRWLMRADRGDRCSEHRLDDWERDVLEREGREWGIQERRQAR
ncbi:uncharacterized protein RHOBADRAFT_46833 [Rhodotorula graminis WP1]|uniref:Uncharacterized protein n=1 Tax=Rhodotorula graminis (strain WP1) TaxID=578459 RepID=A0A0P9EL02_RHOGW|nr:uncharacterized protein RHOBADRAFT_46833 [Rhodotorula graminis WP1]KPV72382.1 hypothetical protein RHOBADRAFT_46833 [Rhodotorula graminis WP1]